MTDKAEIAIVGVGCRFPGADNVKEYWNVLKNGENHVKEVPRDRWNIDAFYDPDIDTPGKMYIRTAGFLDNIDKWDHHFFDINDAEAELVDPQQRIVLECVHMALEDGGITKNDIDGTKTGVYIGSMTDDYKGCVMDDSAISSNYSVTGTHNSVISARVSYTYNLKGPSMTIDTACSSSLVAIDVASQALISGSCNMCICGGVNILMDPQLFIALSKARMLSPSGQCKTFTKDADGYARGEGCGIVLLKKLTDALKDGNKIWGTIRTGTNQDGHMMSPITAPSGIQQEGLIMDIFERYGLQKQRVHVIEAHGTGTSIGDPTEVNALGKHFGKSAHAYNEVFIGSVKTNIGHLEAAAGVAGLIKVLLMMKYNTIVPSLWYNKENENPLIKLSQHGFVVPTECKTWEKSGNRLACVNSFGFGGTNAHCIVEEFSPNEIQANDLKPVLPFIVTVSANCKESLVANVQHLCKALKSDEYDIGAVSYTSTCRRHHRPYRKAFFGYKQGDIIAESDAFLSISDIFLSPTNKKVIFVFCGVGTAWIGMCRSLMNLDIFKEAVLCIDRHLEPLSGWSISSKLINSNNILENPMVTHIAIFACQIGLAALWTNLGIIPDVVVGQSVGEVAAAYVAGYLDLPTAVKIIFYRSKFLANVTCGTMTVVRNVDVELIENYCGKHLSVSIAVYYSPTSCTVSGLTEDITKLKNYLSTKEDISPDFVDLDVQCAYHSAHVDPAAIQLEKHLLGNIEANEPHTQMVSTVTGQIENKDTIGSSKYWENNVKMPVRLSHAIEVINVIEGHKIFLELGPSPVLRAHIDKIFVDQNNNKSIPSMRKKGEVETFARALCTLFEVGLEPKWTHLFPCRSDITDIPIYQFNKHQALYQSPIAIVKKQGHDPTSFDHLYVKQLQWKEGEFHFKAEFTEETTPFVFQHTVKGLLILPGASYADVGFEIGSHYLGLAKQDILLSLEFLRPVKVEPDIKTILHVSTAAQRDALLFHAKQNNVTMCKGWIKSRKKNMALQKKIDIEFVKVSITSFEGKYMTKNEMYATLESLGFKYGRSFTVMKTCITNSIESLTEIEIPDHVVDQYKMTTLHPCVLDGMMQSTINTTTEEILVKAIHENLSFMPVAIGEIRVLGKLMQEMYIFTKRINTTVLDTVLQVHYNILLLSKNGDILAELRNYTTYAKRNASFAPCELNYNLTWHPVENTGRPNPPNVVVVTSRHSKEVCSELKGFSNIFMCENVGNLSNEKFIVHAFENTTLPKEINAVVLLIEKFDIDAKAINQELAEHIHQCVKNNCMILAGLIKYMNAKNVSAPLYVVTQNTQPTFPDKTTTVNIVGVELWGFVRSVNLEFIYGDITLVDLQPSFMKTKYTLFSFIQDSCQSLENTKPEIIIRDDKIFGAQFTKVPKKKLIPKLRSVDSVSRKTNSSHKVLANSAKDISSLFLTKSDDIEENSEVEYISVHVQSVSLHPLAIYPRTARGVLLDQDIWKECLDDGYSFFGLEYTCKSSSYVDVLYKKPENDTIDQKVSFKKREILTIFPSEINTKMFVPKACTVDLKDIPFYQPGLILTTILCWELSKYVPMTSSVLVYSRKDSSISKLILESLVCSRRNAYIVNLRNSQINKNETKIDVLITVEKLDSSFPALRRCKNIICLHECISEPIRLKASRAVDQTVVEFSAIKLLERKIVSRCLPKVIKWLQNNHKSLGILNCSMQQLADSDVPFPTLKLMKNGKAILPFRNPLDKLFSKSAMYIVTGGLTGLGWEIVKLLAEMGAGKIASVSRKKRKKEKAKDIEELEKATGCKIFTVIADVCDLHSISCAIKEIKVYAGTGPIRGIFHGAGVLNGRLLMNLKSSHIDFVLKPKVIGTLNMHILSNDMDLDFFVVSSSINSLIGSPGQSNYGAANSFLDTIMKWRRQHGLPGQAINWGALSVGMASRPEFVDSFTKRGFNLLSVLEIRSCLQDALMRNATSIVYTNIDWDIFAKDYANPQMQRARLQMSILIEQEVSYSMDVNSDETDNMSFNAKTLAKVGKERQLAAITEVIYKILNKVIKGNLNQINMSSTLADMAFDSMSTVTFINIVHDITGYRIQPSFMLNTDNTLNGVVHLLFHYFFADKSAE